MQYESDFRQTCCYMIRYKCREGDLLAMVMVVVRVDQSSSESKLPIIWKPLLCHEDAAKGKDAHC